MRRGILDEASAARLLIAAALLDLVVVYFATLILTPPLQREFSFLRVDYAEAGVFVVLTLVMWAICDLLLMGYSPGRLAVGVEMGHRSGRHLSLPRRAVRLIGKLSTLGLTGLRLDRLAGYDRAAGTVWLSAMSRVSPIPPDEWRLRFLSGEYAGRSILLAKIPGFTAQKQIRIGRDRQWANLALNDQRISSQHCVLRIRNQMVEIQDGNGAGRPSANGTYCDTRRIPHDAWTPIDPAKGFQIGGIRIIVAT